MRLVGESGPTWEITANMSDQQSRSQIVITLLPDERVCIRSTCAGRFDSTYAPMNEGRLPAEVEKLLAELRQREAGPKT